MREGTWRAELLLPKRKGVAIVLFSLLIFSVWYYLSSRLKSHESASQTLQPFTHQESSNSLSSLHCAKDCNAYTTRLHRYCHKSLLNGTEHLSSQEGKLASTTDSDQFELVHVNLVARHGDRTPVSKFKIGPKIFFECGLFDGSFNWGGLDDFPQPIPLPPSAKVSNANLPLNPGTKSRDCGDVKGIGKLTSLGYKQHASLGHLINDKYNTFVRNIVSDVSSLYKNTFVQSTDFPRTIHSAAAFLLGFLPDSSKLRQAARIHVSQGSLLETPPTGIKKIYSSCRDYYQLWTEDRTQVGYFKNEKKRHHLLSNLCGMFRLECHSPIVSKVFEHVMIRGCHDPKNILPCYKQTENCVDYSQARKLFGFADWVWSNEHPMKTSIVALLPFLKHSVLVPMEKLITPRKILSNSPLPGSYKVMLSFTHDDTIVKLLTSLKLPVHEWIPYASRVVFELWKRKNGGDHPKDYMVRILFNGVPVTEKTGAWKEGMQRDLVPFFVLKSFLTTGKYRDLKSYNKICGIS